MVKGGLYALCLIPRWLPRRCLFEVALPRSWKGDFYLPCLAWWPRWPKRSPLITLQEILLLLPFQCTRSVLIPTLIHQPRIKSSAEQGTFKLNFKAHIVSIGILPYFYQYKKHWWNLDLNAIFFSQKNCQKKKGQSKSNICIKPCTQGWITTVIYAPRNSSRMWP